VLLLAVLTAPAATFSPALGLTVTMDRHEWVNRLWAWDVGPWKRVG
jgi:hypothetical protein